MTLQKKLLFIVAALVAFFALSTRDASAATNCFQVQVEGGSPRTIRGLYFYSLCGRMQAEVLSVVNSGEGRVFALPDDLATALDRVTPLMHRVDYVYVRGGGDKKPTLAVPFTNGVSSLLFKSNAKWQADQVQGIAHYWDMLPYEFMRRATAKFNDAVLLEGDKVNISINILGFSVPIASLRDALAYPFGFVLITESAANNIKRGGYRGPTIAMHELAHYNHYYDEGLTPFAFAGDFGSITRRNCTIFWVIPIPFCYREHDGVTQNAYVSTYARNGELGILEDYADTICHAISATQVLREERQFQSVYAPKELFDSRDAFLQRKAAFMTNRYTYSMKGPMDADRDGVTFVPSDGPGSASDCSDINPAQSKNCGPIDSCANKEDGWFCSEGAPYAAIRCAGKQIAEGSQCLPNQICKLTAGKQPDCVSK